MKKLGLKDKLLEELKQKVKELETSNSLKQQKIDLQQSIINDLNVKIEEKDQIIRSFDIDKIIDCIDKYSDSNSKMLTRIAKKIESDGYQGLAEYLFSELSKKDEFMSDILKKVNFLSLSATKKSERYVPKDDKGLSNGQTIDSKDSNIKHRKKEDAQARGNNGAKHNPHNEIPGTENIISVYPAGFSPKNEGYEILNVARRYKLIYIHGYFRKQYYDLYKVKDLRNNRILFGELPDTPLKNSSYSCSSLAEIIVSKYAWHESTPIMCKRFQGLGFDANDRTIDGLIGKCGNSLFFHNIDKAMYLAVIEQSYLFMDESFSKVKTDTAKLNSEFIKECWFWGLFAIDIKLIWYSCSNGSRRDAVGYSFVDGIDHKCIIQSDAKSCYRNMEQVDKFENIIRLGCLQHLKRKFKLLEDPRAKDILSRLNGLYVLDHKREELAEEDYINGQEWTIEDHLRWRKENLLPEFNSIVNDMSNILDSSSKIENDSSTSKEQPISKALKSAIKYAITESDAIRRIFKSDRLCFLDSNQIYPNFIFIPTFQRNP